MFLFLYWFWNLLRFSGLWSHVFLIIYSYILWIFLVFCILRPLVWRSFWLGAYIFLVTTQKNFLHILSETTSYLFLWIVNIQINFLLVTFTKIPSWSLSSMGNENAPGFLFPIIRTSKKRELSPKHWKDKSAHTFSRNLGFCLPDDKVQTLFSEYLYKIWWRQFPPK